MNALQSYSSDNESEPDITRSKKDRHADQGTNYDNVGMDISEESSDEDSNTLANKAAEVPYDDTPCKNGEDSYAPRRKQSPDEFDAPENDSLDRSRERSSLIESNIREGLRHEREKDDLSRQERSHRDSKDSRDRDRGSRDHRERGHYHRNRDGGRHRYDDRRRRSRSRSRERRYTKSKSRSRSRSRERRRRRSRSRSRSRDRDRRKPHEIRKEAQQKLAALKAENPNFDQTELLKKGMEAQVAELSKQTGIALPSYYNPAHMNPLKLAEQERKKKLLWGNKAKTEPTPFVAATSITQPQPQPQPQQPLPPSITPQEGTSDGRQANMWASTTFCNDSDGKMAEKFRRLMGVKASGPQAPNLSTPPPPTSSAADKPDLIKNQETLFSSMERQYEMARLATHTHKGFGLGFSSQPFVPKQQ